MPIFYTTSFVTAATATNATIDIWEHWASTTSTVAVTETWAVWANVNITPDQYAQFDEELRVRGAQIRAEAERKRAEEAGGRAHELLLRYLDEKQRADLVKENWFLVDGKSGVRYRIKRGVGLVGNVEVLNADGSVRHRLCAHDRQEGTPLDDQLLTQKFYLEHHEEEFLRVANRH